MNRIVSWDWKEQPDIDELAVAVLDVSGGTVHIYEVATGTDEYAILVSDTPLSGDEVADAWRAEWTDDESWEPS